MKKYKFILFVIFIVIVFLPRLTYANESGLGQSLNEIEDIKQKVKEYSGLSIDEYLPSLELDGGGMDIAKMDEALSIENLMGKLLDLVAREVKESFGSIIKIFIIALLAAVLKIVADSFEGGTSSKLAQMACQAAMLSFVVVNIRTVLDISSNVVVTSADFMKATLPAMISLMCVSGSVASSSVFSPLIFFACEVITNIISHTILPLFAMGIAFFGIDMLLDNMQLKKLAKLIRATSYWGIGLLMSLFVGISTIKGIAGQTVDGIGGRTIKYAVSTFIPVVGGYLSDAADTIMSGMLAMRNICGIGICIGIVGICIVPVIKIFAIGFAYKIVAVLISAVAGEKFCSFVDESANSIFGIGGVTLSVVVMFVLSVAMFMSAGVGAR